MELATDNAGVTADLAGATSTQPPTDATAPADAGPAVAQPEANGGTAAAAEPKVDRDREAYERLEREAAGQDKLQTADPVDPARDSDGKTAPAAAASTHAGLDARGKETLRRAGLLLPVAAWNGVPEATRAELLERAKQVLRDKGRASQAIGQARQQNNTAAGRQPARGTRAGGVAPTPAQGYDDVNQLADGAEYGDGPGLDQTSLLNDDEPLDDAASQQLDDADLLGEQDHIDPRDQQSAGVGQGRQLPPATRQQRGDRQAAAQQQLPPDLDEVLQPLGDYFGDEVGGRVKQAFAAQQAQLAQTQAALQQLLQSQQMERQAKYAPEEREAFGKLTTELGRPLNPHEQRQIKHLATEHWHVSQRSGEGITWGDAIRRAGQQIKQPDIKLQAQQDLLDRRKRSLGGSPVRPSQSTAARADRPVTKEERDRAIFDQLENGKRPGEARAAVIHGS